MSWIAITIFAVFSRAFYSIATRTLSTNIIVSAKTVAVVLPLVAAFMSLLLIPFLGFSLDGLANGWWIAVILAASQGLGNIIYFFGQKDVDSGLTQVALSSKLVWTAIMSVVFLNSSFSTTQIAGMILLFTSVILVQNFGKIDDRTKKGMFVIGISAIAFSVFSIAGADLADKINPVTYLIVTYLGASIFALASGFNEVKSDLKYISNNRLKSLKYFGFASATSTIYFTLVYYAYREASDPGIVAVLVNAQVVTTVLVAAFLLKERDHLPRKVFAGIVVVLASYLISGL